MTVINLAARRSLITGSGQGIGRGIALALAASGSEVVVNDLDADRAEAVVDEVVAAGGVAVAAPFDVTDFGAVEAAVAGASPNHLPRTGNPSCGSTSTAR